MIPKIAILPPPQIELWKELDNIPEEFILYGGTAVALHLGHRESIDFDFFSNIPFDPAILYERINFLKDAEILQQAANSLTCLVHGNGEVKISFFAMPTLKRINHPHVALENNLKIASLMDLAGMKAVVVQRRAELKDYLDIDAILKSGISLASAISAAKIIYGQQFNPQLTLKALSYFEDGDVHNLSAAAKLRIIQAVAEIDLDDLPNIEVQI